MAKTQAKKPFQVQKSTRLQGTVLKLFDYHCEMNDMKDAEYLRWLVIQHLKSTYELRSTGGIVKIKH